MRINRGREPLPSEQRGPTFTGRVWADPVLSPKDGVVVNVVFFEPGARTHWHHHEIAQVLHVTAGSGWVQVFAPNLAADQIRVLREEKHAAIETNGVGQHLPSLRQGQARSQAHRSGRNVPLNSRPSSGHGAILFPGRRTAWLGAEAVRECCSLTA